MAVSDVFAHVPVAATYDAYYFVHSVPSLGVVGCFDAFRTEMMRFGLCGVTRLVRYGISCGVRRSAASRRPLRASPPRCVRAPWSDLIDRQLLL